MTRMSPQKLKLKILRNNFVSQNKIWRIMAARAQITLPMVLYDT